MISLIILGLVAVFSIYWTIKNRNVWPAAITLGMIAGMIIMPFSSREGSLIWVYVYLVFVCSAFVYGLIFNDKKPTERLSICLISLGIFVYWLWTLNHWHGNTMLAPVFVLLVICISLLSKQNLKKETGFLSIMAADAIAILLDNWLLV